MHLPARLPRSEAEHDSSRRLRRMSNCVGVECGEAKIGGTIHEAPIFSPQSNVFHDRKIGSTAIRKDSSSLPLRSGYRPETVTRRVKDQSAAFCQNVWTES